MASGQIVLGAIFYVKIVLIKGAYFNKVES